MVLFSFWNTLFRCFLVLGCNWPCLAVIRHMNKRTFNADDIIYECYIHLRNAYDSASF
jgi:hypothetical protein